MPQLDLLVGWCFQVKVWLGFVLQAHYKLEYPNKRQWTIHCAFYGGDTVHWTVSSRHNTDHWSLLQTRHKWTKCTCDLDKVGNISRKPLRAHIEPYEESGPTNGLLILHLVADARLHCCSFLGHFHSCEPKQSGKQAAPLPQTISSK